MKLSQKTLIDRLEEIVDSTHIEEVKTIVSMLSHINDFKHKIEGNISMEDIYKKISNELKIVFSIDNFTLTQIKNGQQEILFQLKNFKSNNYSYKSPIAKNIDIQIDIFCEELNSLQELSLNTYFNEIIHLIYIQFVLNDLMLSSVRDPLTELKNRVSFNEDMKEFIPLALRESMNIGVLLINIDRFTAVNDEHGNEFGDTFLKHYAMIIKETIRKSDIAVRFSGGEFLVLLINIDSEEKTIEIANNLREKLAQSYLVTPAGDQFKKTVCIGISMFPEDSSDIHEVVKKSEIALSDARDSGRDQILRFKESIESPIELF